MRDTMEGMDVFFVRHGQTDANIHRTHLGGNDPINATGHFQAKKTAEYLKSLEKPDILASSEFLRAQQTANIISQALKMPITTFPDLYETKFGVWDGKPLTEVLPL